MKKLLSMMLVTGAFAAYSQPKKAPKMAAVLVPGYYVTAKGDTVKGEIQTNPDDVTSFYHTFNFKPAGKGKPAPVDAKKARYYGFEGRNFAVIPYENGDIYAEYLVRGRLVFMEYLMPAREAGEDIIASVYFVQDSKADDSEKELRELKQISQKFYKRDLKPYMKAQPMIWSDMDKFTFEEKAVIKALKEFNGYYSE